jgi:hypothetical protein
MLAAFSADNGILRIDVNIFSGRTFIREMFEQDRMRCRSFMRKKIGRIGSRV